MRAGMLTHLAEFQRRTPSRNGYGEQHDAWRTVGTFRASIKPARNSYKEVVQADSIVNEVTHILRMRKNVCTVFVDAAPFGEFGFGQINPEQASVQIPLTPDLRVVSDEKIYRILSVVSVDNADRELEMALIEGWEE